MWAAARSTSARPRRPRPISAKSPPARPARVALLDRVVEDRAHATSTMASRARRGAGLVPGAPGRGASGRSRKRLPFAVGAPTDVGGPLGVGDGGRTPCSSPRAPWSRLKGFPRRPPLREGARRAPRCPPRARSRWIAWPAPAVQEREARCAKRRLDRTGTAHCSSNPPLAGVVLLVGQHSCSSSSRGKRRGFVRLMR